MSAARPDGAARVFAPSGAMCKFSPNDPVWTGAICACGPLECKAGIHPCATRPDGAAIRRALQKGGIEHHDLQGSDIDAWHDRDKCRICAALADLDVLLRDRDEARQALRDLMPFVKVPSDIEPQHVEALGRVRAAARAVLGSLTEGEQ